MRQTLTMVLVLSVLFGFGTGASIDTDQPMLWQATGSMLVDEADEYKQGTPAFVTTAASESYDEQVDALFKRYRTIGGAVVIYKDNQPYYERYYGKARKASGYVVDANTYFRVASVTKFISGIGAMKLVEAGKLSLDQDLNEFLGVYFRNPQYPDTKITLRMLMTHTSGLLDSGNLRNRAKGLEDIFFKGNPTKNFADFEPGKDYRYSNYGAGIVGAMMEKASGQSVNRYMMENVFQPLGLDAAYHVSYLSRPESVVDQFNSQLALERPAAKVLNTTYDDTADVQMHYRTTIGDVFITARDLAKLTSVLCNGGEYEGSQVLQKQSVAQMLAEQQGANGIEAQTPYGLFCQHFTSLKEGKTFYGHQGISLGMITDCIFDPETGFIMVLMTNGSSRARDEEITDFARAMFNLFN